jgi:hypothetical protein
MVSKHSNFKDSAWLTRGWALQELVAPVNAEFYSYVWECIGTKETLKYEISAITGIHLEVLTGRSQKFQYYKKDVLGSQPDIRRN